jgi:four helix bundle protein
MGTDNAIVMKSKAFAIRIIRLYQFLTTEKKEFVLSKQLLKSGTSIGANVKEAIRGFSKKDFRFKLGIALKEASESEYWLELLFETDYISEKQFQSLKDDCVELIKILTAILNSSNEKYPDSEQN